MERRFLRYELRTTDVDSARAFYTRILGPWGEDVQGAAFALHRAPPVRG